MLRTSPQPTLGMVALPEYRPGRRTYSSHPINYREKPHEGGKHSKTAPAPSRKTCHTIGPYARISRAFHARAPNPLADPTPSLPEAAKACRHAAPARCMLQPSYYDDRDDAADLGVQSIAGVTNSDGVSAPRLSTRLERAVPCLTRTAHPSHSRAVLSQPSRRLGSRSARVCFQSGPDQACCKVPS